ncbi:hypothetical protein MWH25_11000 [Natroniella acetigena]|uniref:hypothetical protein n=1 Tax=Natroniella acetigena TaxID=52004 RepID=UPI00200A8430|nr:hypothetical protein [Natroniella acetigena]MCK8828260.1 hypothetical protein [Natroniella acetigena]
MQKSVWSLDGVSEYPLSQPMVGQKDFYHIFNNFVESLSNATMARIFPLIADWGIGKSRIGFELVSQVIGKDKGWIIRKADQEPEKVRILAENFADGILPIYISYSDMNHDYLGSGEWVPFGTYIALKGLATAEDKENLTFGERVAVDLVNHLEPMGFSQDRLKEILKVDHYQEDELLMEEDILDQCVVAAKDYFKRLGIERFMIIADEVESKTEIINNDIDEETKKKLDGEAIQLINHAIKHENEKNKYPYISYLLLCSPAIGDQFEGLGALDRRNEILEIEQNSFADITDYIEYLKKDEQVFDYPEGLVEAAYTIAGGNFGWFNMIMGSIDQYIINNGMASPAKIFEDRLKSVSRFEKLLDKASLEYIQVADKYRPLVKELVLLQLPRPETDFDSAQLNALKTAKTEMGEQVFAEFKVVTLNKPELANHLVHEGDYENIGEDVFSNAYGGDFDLDVLLRSIKTFSLGTEENEYLVGADKATFIDQIRMLYPDEEAETAAELIYDLIQTKITGDDTTYIGPSFSFLSRFDKRYASSTGQAGYLITPEDNQALEEQLEEMMKDRGKEVNRIITGFCRVIEKGYPTTNELNLDLPAKRIKFNDAAVPLTVHPEGYVDVVWGQDITKLKRVLKSRKIANEGVHPIFVLASSSAIEQEVKQIKEEITRVGRGIIFISLNKIQQEVLEVLAVDRDYLDLREARFFTKQFRDRVNQIHNVIQDKSKEWFEGIDSQGWVLRPIKPDRRKNQEIIRTIAKGYKEMLINDCSLLELEAEDSQLSDEEYEELKNIMSKLELPKKFSNKDYKTIGIFKEEDQDYIAQVPLCFSRLISYLADTKKSWDQIQKDFYFSLQESVATGKSMMKIIRQLSIFLQELGVIEIEEQHNVRKTKRSLETKYHVVETWLENEYDQILDGLAKVLGSWYIKRLQDTRKNEHYKKLNDAKESINNLEIDKLKKVTVNLKKIWTDVVDKLETFNSNCDYVYKKDGWNQLEFNTGVIQNLDPLDKSRPIWERLRYIQLFHQYISRIKKPAIEKIEEKIDQVMTDNEYRGYEIPVAPLTLLLREYKKEISYSTDVDRTKTVRLEGDSTEMLAHNLKEAKYNKALTRLKSILSKCGLGLSDSAVEWQNSGLINRYQVIKESFQKIVDDYLENKDEVEYWENFFETAPESWKENKSFKQLKRIVLGLQTFLEAGLQEKIEDAEEEGKITKLLDIMEEEVKNNLNLGEQLKGTITSVQNFVKEKKNSWYDERLINAINRLRANNNQERFSYDKSQLPQEDAYQKAKSRVSKLMGDLQVEGEDYFADLKTTFDFYIRVVENNGEVDWNKYQDEQQELLEQGLIKIKIEVV